MPKIPSIHITDLAAAMAPNIQQRIIGIRPGEKLHEVMCPADDSHLTIEFEDHFVLGPTISFHARDNNFDLNALEEEGCLVEHGFEYSSGSNPHFLSVDEILEVNHLSGM